MHEAMFQLRFRTLTNTLSGNGSLRQALPGTLVRAS